jgi:hypothetical protein
MDRRDRTLLDETTQKRLAFVDAVAGRSRVTSGL